MDEQAALALFQFSQRWVALGMVDKALLAQMVSRWESGVDPHPEHYRNWAFNVFVQRNRPLSAELALALYELGEGDPDQSFGGSMMVHIVHLRECPIELLHRALTSGRAHLERAARRRLEAGPTSGQNQS